jgi:hypothetical protein
VRSVLCTDTRARITKRELSILLIAKKTFK